MIGLINKIIRIIFLFSFFALVSINFGGIMLAENQAWGSLGTTPTVVLDRFASRVNTERIQDNALNDTSNIQGQYASEYKLSNTLDAIRSQITPYIQWTMYIGLSIAVILIIYNGLLMVTNALHDQGDIDKIKLRLKNIAIGVIILTGFYVIIQLFLATLNYILQ